MIKGKRGNKKRQRFAKTARCHEIKRAQTRKRKKKKKGEDEKREARAKKNVEKGKRKERRVVLVGHNSRAE